MTVPHLKSSFIPDEKIGHGFFGRKGGVSDGVYDSLNIDKRREDNPEAVQENHSRIVQTIGGHADQGLHTVDQVHGIKCLVLHDDIPEQTTMIKADALVTDRPGLALSMLTADCVPVLFYAENKHGRPVIGAAHAGWKGALDGVLQETIQQILKLDVTDLKHITAAIGPCIAMESYEVSNDFVTPFVQQDAQNERFFSAAGREGHKMFDMVAYVDHILKKVGIGKIGDQAVDTYAHDHEYFSYRRACHDDLPDTGRQASVIMIRS